MDQLDITTNELLAVLQVEADKNGASEEFFGSTRQELQDKLGWGSPRTLKYIKVCIAQGLVKPTYIPRVNIHGEVAKVKGYVLTKCN